MVQFGLSSGHITRRNNLPILFTLVLIRNLKVNGHQSVCLNNTPTQENFIPIKTLERAMLLPFVPNNRVQLMGLELPSLVPIWIPGCGGFGVLAFPQLRNSVSYKPLIGQLDGNSQYLISQHSVFEEMLLGDT